MLFTSTTQKTSDQVFSSTGDLGTVFKPNSLWSLSYSVLNHVVIGLVTSQRLEGIMGRGWTSWVLSVVNPQIFLCDLLT